MDKDNLFPVITVFFTLGSWITLLLIYFCPIPQLTRTPFAVIGPTFKIWVGLLGSCMQEEEGDIECSSHAFNPIYDFSVLPQDAPAFVLQKPPALFRVIFLMTVITLGLNVILSFHVLGLRWKPANDKFTLKRFNIQNVKMYDRFLLRACIALAFFNVAIGPLSCKLMDLYFRAMRQHFNAFVSQRHPDITATIGTSPTYAYWCNSIGGLPGVLAAITIHYQNVEEAKAERDAAAAMAAKKAEEDKAKQLDAAKNNNSFTFTINRADAP